MIGEWAPSQISHHKYHKSQISQMRHWGMGTITNITLQIWQIWQITNMTNMTNAWLGNGHLHKYDKSQISQITNITNAWLGNGHLHRLHWFIADSGKHSQPQTFCKTCHCYILPMSYRPNVFKLKDSSFTFITAVRMSATRPPIDLSDSRLDSF